MTLDSAMSFKKRSAARSCICKLANFEVFEIRKNPRKTFSKSIYFASQNRYYEGVIKNLGHGGAFIETKTKFSNGDEIKLVVPGQNKYIQIRCKIIHFAQTGFGVKFKNVLKINKSREIGKSSNRQAT